MKKALALILAVVMCLSLFAACNNDAETTTTAAGEATTAAAGGDTTAAATNPTELRVVTMFGGDDAHTDVYKSYNTKFETETGNTINDNSAVADDTWKATVAADFTADNAPDVMFFFNSATAEPIVATGELVDLATIQAVDADYAKNISTGSLNSVGNTASDGKVYCVPVKGFAEGVYVNKTIFADKGIAIPTSWETMMTAVTALKDAGVVPFATSVGAEPHYFFEHLILSVGGTDALTANPKTAEEVPAAWAEGLASIKELYDAGAFPEDTATLTGADAKDLFLQGKAAMYMDGSWANSSIPTADAAKEGLITQDDVQMIAFPCKNADAQGTVVSAVSSGWYITKSAWEDADKQAAAIAYVKMMTSDQAVADFCGKGIGGIPVADGAAALLTGVTDPCSVGYAELVAAAGDKVCAPAQDLLTTAARTQAFADLIQVATGDMTAEDLISGFMALNVAE